VENEDFDRKECIKVPGISQTIRSGMGM